jgi:LmbE family N-acetylglucosaminyl deacetylase
MESLAWEGDPDLMSSEPAGVMVVVAHPDDAELTCGGTVAKWVSEGRDVTYVVATRGDKGSDDPSMDSDRLAKIRDAEQRAAAEVLGVDRTLFLDYLDGELTRTLELCEDITRLIRTHRPGVLVTFDPTNRFAAPTGYSRHLNHPDHRVIGDASLDAVFPFARDRLTFPDLATQGLSPHKVPDVYLVGTEEPNVAVDITEFVDIKIRAAAKHASQLGDLAAVRGRIESHDRTVSQDGSVRYVERFRHIVLE